MYARIEIKNLIKSIEPAIYVHSNIRVYFALSFQNGGTRRWMILYHVARASTSRSRCDAESFSTMRNSHGLRTDTQFWNTQRASPVFTYFYTLFPSTSQHETNEEQTASLLSLRRKPCKISSPRLQDVSRPVCGTSMLRCKVRNPGRPRIEICFVEACRGGRLRRFGDRLV